MLFRSSLGLMISIAVNVFLALYIFTGNVIYFVFRRNLNRQLEAQTANISQLIRDGLDRSLPQNIEPNLNQNPNMSTPSSERVIPLLDLSASVVDSGHSTMDSVV